MSDHISVTQANMYLRCPMQHYYRYVEGLRVPPRGAMVLGSAVHEGAAATYERIARGEAPEPEEAATLAAEAAERRIEQEEPLLDPDAGETPGAIKDAAAAGAAEHASAIAPAVARPELIEQRIEATIADPEDAEPVRVVAVVDVYDAAARAVRDLKVAGRAKSQADAEASTQLNLYALLLGAAGKPVARVAYDTVVVTAAKPNAARGVPVEADASSERAAAALASVMGAARGIRQGVYYHRTEGWHCSPKWCGYWERCAQDRARTWHVVTAAPLGKAEPEGEEE